MVPAAITDSQDMFWLIFIGSIEAISSERARAFAHMSTLVMPLMQSGLAQDAEKGAMAHKNATRSVRFIVFCINSGCLTLELSGGVAVRLERLVSVVIDPSAL